LIIQLSNISVAYGKFLALDDVSLNIDTGAVGLLGPNGAGKTTLIKALLGLLKLHAGNGEVLGMDIQNQNIRQQVGYMPENDCYIPGMNAVSFVAYMGQLCGMPRKDSIQRAHEVLQYVDADEERYRMIETYSTGMKQKIKLAQALIHDPKLLLLDEPTTGLDPKGRQDMLDMIKNISTIKNMNIVLSSHLLPDIEYTCQDVVVLQKGKKVIQGNIDELKSSNQRMYEIKIKGDKNLFISAINQMGYEQRETEEGLFRIALPDDISPNILVGIACKSGLQIRHLSSTKHSLEDIFVQAIGGKNADS